MSADVLTGLPRRWRADRLLCSDRARWAAVEPFGDDEGVLLVVSAHEQPGVSLLGRGDGATVDRLVEAVVDGGRLDLVRWMSVPRTSRPTPRVLDALGLTPFSAWDWMASDTEPPATPGEDRVRRLDPSRDAEAIRSCLAEANPSTSADPTAAGEIGWWGVDGGSGLAGVVGVAARAASDGGASWHLHGLGVRPVARGTGVGSALAAVATRTGLAAGAEWVSLGLYSSNDTARRLYERLGFRTEAELSSFAPTGADRPPA